LSFAALVASGAGVGVKRQVSWRQEVGRCVRSVLPRSSAAR
jgi:hypothetical protein